TAAASAASSLSRPTNVPVGWASALTREARSGGPMGRDDARMAPLESRRPDAGWTAIADPRQIAPCRPPLATARAPDGDRARWAAAGREPGRGQPALPPARRPPATPRDAREPRPPGRARPRGDPHRGPQLVPGRALEPARALHHAGRALSRLPPP